MAKRFNYARTKATADRLIKKFGIPSGAVFLEPGTASGDAWNPTQTDAVEHAVEAVVLDYTTREIDGQRILATDKRALVAVGTMTQQPTTEWSLRVGGIEYKLVPPLKTIAPGGTTVLWDLQCRKA